MTLTPQQREALSWRLSHAGQLVKIDADYADRLVATIRFGVVFDRYYWSDASENWLRLC